MSILSNIRNPNSNILPKSYPLWQNSKKHYECRNNNSCSTSSSETPICSNITR